MGDWVDPEYDDFDDYDEYETKGMKKLNQKGGRKSKGSFIQQQEKTQPKGSFKYIKEWSYHNFLLFKHPKS